MTDNEINEAVAVKLGWLKIILRTPSKPSWKDPTGKVRGWDAVPDYCHSIEAAWEIVEKLSILGCGYWVKMWSSPVGFTVQIMKAIPEKESALINADSAPMAICTAFLKMS